jgi:hypothetical protein
MLKTMGRATTKNPSPPLTLEQVLAMKA